LRFVCLLFYRKVAARRIRREKETTATRKAAETRKVTAEETNHLHRLHPILIAMMTADRIPAQKKMARIRMLAPAIQTSVGWQNARSETNLPPSLVLTGMASKNQQLLPRQKKTATPRCLNSSETIG
jgi:hypothetical protein